jgi:hypothetical protein
MNTQVAVHPYARVKIFRSWICLATLGLLLGSGIAHAALGSDWVQATDAAPWSARASHEMVSHDGFLYLLSGSYKNDVWKSPDGISWTLVLENAPWVGRRDPGFISFQGKLWLMGGWIGGYRNYLGDVWSSTDGATWTLVNAEAFTPRPRVYPVVFDNKIWVAGGNLDGVNNDIWMTEDGEEWSQVLGDAPWLPRWGQEMLVHDNKMWLLGGGREINEKFADVWYSENGTDWLQLPDAPWIPRAGHAAVTFDHRMWIIGGDDADLVRLNDVWSSADGVAWTLHTESAPWEARRVLAAAVHQDRIWMTGGENAARQDLNDVWFTEVSLHAADQNKDRRIGLSELLRVVQLFALGSFGCEPGTGDGYRPWDTDQDCEPHSSDYNPQNWRISISELIRLIQLYKFGAYHPCAEGEDGFCPGPA